MSGIENGDANIPGLTAGNTTQYYDYSNLSGSGVFETPNWDGLITEEVDESYHFVGAVDKTSYSIHYSESNQGSEDHLTWWDYTKTSVALAGAIVETSVGVLTSETGIGGVVAYDGSIRVAGTFSKLITMIETGKKSKSDLIPTSAGAVIGAIIDHGTADNHQAQAIGGTVNDIIMLFIPHGQTDYTLLNIGDEELNGYTPNTAGAIVDDYNSIQKSFK